MITDWTNIPEYPNYYISKSGIVKNKKGIFLKPDIGKLGYSRVTLSNYGKVKRFLLHRLMAIVFIPNPENKEQVNHINGIKADNSAINLEWVTRSENEKHAHLTGLKNHKGEHHPSNKLTASQVLEIRFLYSGKKLNQKGLAEKFNITFQTVSQIILYKTWKNI